MGVSKYRSVADMPPPSRESTTPLHVRMAAAWERAQLRGRRPLPRGVLRFSNPADADAQRRLAEREWLQAQAK